MRIAAVDLGSNSFHLLVADASPDGSFEPLFREKEMLRLGDVVARTGRVTDEAADGAVETVRRFKALADNVEVDEIVACATAAIREAENGADLVDRFRHEAGVEVRVIGGLEEAALIFRAVQASVVLDPPPAVCLDLGGGSLEVTVGDAAELTASVSVKLGVGRLTAELVESDPPSDDDVARLRARVDEVLGPVARRFAPLGPRMMVGTSGTLNDLARMAVAAETGVVPLSVNQLRVSRRALGEVLDSLVAVPEKERRKLPGLESRRAELAPAGAVVVLGALELFGLDGMVAGTWALREGMVLEAVSRRTGSGAGGDPREIRAASVLDLCQRCGWREDHARQVARLAAALFDQTRDVHGLGEEARDLLVHAAHLHDIGEHVAGESHHKHSAYLIQHGRLRGFSPHEVAVLATLARYHRRGEPKASFEPFGAMDADARAEVRLLAGLLQVADGLDRGHGAAVRDVHVDLTPDAVRCAVVADGDVDLDLWGARRKRSLFESVTGRRLELSVVSA